MKILVAGNMINLAYIISKELRNDGVDIDLLMEKDPHPVSDPIKFDSSLNNVYPEWIIFYDKKKWTWKSNIIKAMRDAKYDLIQAHVELPIFAYLSRKPFVAYTQGSDFRELAFSNSFRGKLIRRAYKKAKIVLFGQPDHYSLFSKLGLKNGIFMPAPWDFSLYSPKPVEKINDKFVIFHPSHQIWRIKGNDVLIRGYSEYVKRNPKCLLIIVDHGIDSKKSKELVNSLAIKKNVEFVKPMSSKKMIEFYQKSDVIADQFIIGSMGAISLEALSSEKPLLSFINMDLHIKLYQEPPPVATAKNVSEVTKQLEVLNDEKKCKNLGKKGREWVKKFHSPEKISSKLQLVYNSIQKKEQVEIIRENISKMI